MYPNTDSGQEAAYKAGDVGFEPKCEEDDEPRTESEDEVRKRLYGTDNITVYSELDNLVELISSYINRTREGSENSVFLFWLNCILKRVIQIRGRVRNLEMERDRLYMLVGKKLQ